MNQQKLVKWREGCEAILSKIRSQDYVIAGYYLGILINSIDCELMEIKSEEKENEPTEI